LDLEIRERGATVWVALSGVLDAARLALLTRRITPLLQRRGRRIVLDGRRLVHLDYRCVPRLLAWSQGLCAFDHQLLLYGWNAYLRAILCVEDWDGQLSPGPVRLPAGHVNSAVGPELGR
jgi:anti-anti-sigma regulatory factor